MKSLGQRLIVFVVGNLILSASFHAINNIMEGKDILGNKIETEKNRVDFMKRIHLGRNEYEIV